MIHVLIVDDNSPDGTGRIADALVRSNPGRAHVLHRQVKDGLGRAYIAGFRQALASGADEVVHMDADFSHRPVDLLKLLAQLDDADVAVGSRWIKGGILDANWERWRYLLSKFANLYARTVTGLKVHDATAGFKAFHREALERIDLDAISSNGYVFHIEMALAAQRAGLRLVEIPIYFDERRSGDSKMSLPIIFEAMRRVWLFRFTGRQQPPNPRRDIAKTEPRS